MGLRRKLRGGLVAFIGFLLSPLSWWNDLFINVPLALGLAWLVALVYRPAFEIALVVGYWLTNALGLVLMRRGAREFAAQGEAKPWSRGELLKDLVVSALYTVLLVALIKCRILQPIPEYFRTPGG